MAALVLKTTSRSSRLRGLEGYARAAGDLPHLPATLGRTDWSLNVMPVTPFPTESMTALGAIRRTKDDAVGFQRQHC